MNHFRNNWRYTFSISIILVCFVIFLRVDHSSEKSVAVLTIPSPSPFSLKPSDQWELVGDRINLSTKDSPLVLNRSDHSVLYVLESSLQYEVDGESPKELFHWDKKGTASVWKWNAGIIIGLPYLRNDNDTSIEQGEWLYIRLSDSMGSPTAQIIQNFIYNPNDLLELSYSKHPELAIMKFRYPDSEKLTFECFVDPITGLQGSVDPVERRNPDSVIPAKTLNKTNTVRTLQAKQWDPVLFSFSDDQGFLIYRRTIENNFIEVKRYPLMQLAGFHYIYNETDKINLLYLHVLDHNEKSLLNPFGSVMFAPFEKALWEDNWKGLSMFSFYRNNINQLETIQYDYLPSKNDYTLKKNTLPLKSTILKSKAESIVTFNKAGQEQILNLYDLLNLTGSDHVDDIWLKYLPASNTIRGEKPSPNEIADKLEKSAETIMLPKYKEPKDFIHYDQLPDNIKSSMDTLLDPSGDYNANPLYRKIGDDWYWIIDGVLYKYDSSEKYKIVGALPVQTSATIGQGAVGIGPKDFMKISDDWIVLDTLGNRVLKLDHSLHIINEAAIAAPFHIKISGPAQFEVDSLNGTTLFDNQLAIIRVKPLELQQVLDQDLEKRGLHRNNLDPGTVIKDTSNGWIWYYEKGNLYQYMPAIKKLKVISIGYQRNYRIPVRMLKHGDQNVLLFDQFAYIFGKDGAWLKTISFLRSEPDSLYDTMSSGEGSLAWDSQDEIIYFNQGYHIIAIDLKKGSATTIFQQNMANTGPIALFKGKLYFTLQAKLYAGVEVNKHSSTEVIALDTKAYSYKRYNLDGYWEVESVKGDKLTLWSFDEPGSGFYTGIYRTYPLNVFL